MFCQFCHTCKWEAMLSHGISILRRLALSIKYFLQFRWIYGEPHPWFAKCIGFKTALLAFNSVSVGAVAHTFCKLHRLNLDPKLLSALIALKPGNISSLHRDGYLPQPTTSLAFDSWSGRYDLWAVLSISDLLIIFDLSARWISFATASSNLSSCPAG